MVHKTDAVGMDVMELSSALAVIRYNEGFAGIERLCEKLCIEVSPRLENAFSTLDASRSRKNVNIIRDQRRRFLKKQGEEAKPLSKSLIDRIPIVPVNTPEPNRNFKATCHPTKIWIPYSLQPLKPPRLRRITVASVTARMRTAR